MIRIGFDGRWYGNSGVGNYITDLLEAFEAEADDIEVIVYEDPSNPIWRIKSDRIRKIPIRAKKYSLREQFELARRCRVDGLDVFHSPFYLTPWLAPCPVVVTIHDLIPFIFNIYSLPKRLLIRMGYWFATMKATRVIADSENTREDLWRILGVSRDKTSVVHLATSRDRYHPNAGADEREYLSRRYGIQQPYVLTLSAKNWRTKNLSVVLEALAICRGKMGCGFQAVIAGPEDGFHEALKDLGSRVEDVVLTGFVSAEDLPKLYRNADVFLVGSRYEGFGLPLLEAMSCGCPVVCSNAGSLAEVAGTGALLVNPDDPEGMSEAVSALLCDQQKRSRLRENAIRRAADFSWEKSANQTVSAYRKAASLNKMQDR